MHRCNSSHSMLNVHVLLLVPGAFLVGFSLRFFFSLENGEVRRRFFFCFLSLRSFLLCCSCWSFFGECRFRGIGACVPVYYAAWLDAFCAVRHICWLAIIGKCIAAERRCLCTTNTTQRIPKWNTNYKRELERVREKNKLCCESTQRHIIDVPYINHGYMATPRKLTHFLLLLSSASIFRLLRFL